MHKISIVTPTYNSELTIKRLALSLHIIKSIIHEWIIADSFSSDNTLAICYENSPISPTIIQTAPSGVYPAMNAGIQAVTASYAWIINSDDYIINFSVQQFLDLADNKKVFFGNVVRPTSNHTYKFINSRQFNRTSYFRLNEVHPTVIVPTAFYSNLGFFNPNYKISADLDLLLRINKSKFYEFCWLPTNIVFFDTGGLSAHNLVPYIEYLRILWKNNVGLTYFIVFSIRYFYSLALPFFSGIN